MAGSNKKLKINMIKFLLQHEPFARPLFDHKSFCPGFITMNVGGELQLCLQYNDENGSTQVLTEKTYHEVMGK